MILNLKTNYKKLELNKIYFHEGLKNNHRIIEVTDLTNILELNNPLVGIYIKNT